MSALGRLVVSLSLEYATYTRGLSKADQESLRFAQNAQKHFDRAAASSKEFFVGVAKGALAAGATYIGLSSAIDALNRSIDDLTKLDDMAQKTGSTVENLSKLQKVASAFDQDFGQVDLAISKLAKGMAGADEESSKVGRALEALGVSAKDAAGELRDPSEVMVDVAKKLQNYQDGAAKTALANDLLGKSGAELLPYLNDVAENVDKFAGVSTQAAVKASEFRDKMGLLRVQAQEMFTTVATDLLPTMTDFIDALTNTKREGDKLTGDSKLTSWADDLAVGLARVVDVAKFIPQLIGAVGGSFKSVAADIEYFGKIASMMNPVAIADSLRRGSNPLADLRAAKESREKAARDANQGYADLWNYQGNATEQAMLRRIGRRNPDGSVGDFMALEAGATPPRGALNYTGGNTADKGGRSGGGGKSVKEAKNEVDEFKKAYWEAQKAVEKSVEAAYAEAAANEFRIQTFGMTRSKIEFIELARLEEQLAQAKTSEGNEEEIKTLTRLADAKRKNANALMNLEGVERDKESDKVKGELDEISEFTSEAARNMQDTMAQGFFGAMNGEMDGLGQHFRQTLQRMMADAAAANINNLLFGKGFGKTGELGAESLIGMGLNLFSSFNGLTVDANGMGMGSDANSLTGEMVRGRRALGGPVEAGGLYEVNERGPEVLSSGGKDYLMMGSQGGQVTPNSAIGGGKQISVTYAPVIQIDSRTDRNEVAALVSKSVKQGNAELVERLQRAGRI